MIRAEITQQLFSWGDFPRGDEFVEFALTRTSYMGDNRCYGL